ncbi:MAG: hypothetical protein L3J91_05350, partial [Thermoplasmata archaeon]|nr:hypothetical protein [Thermoplasmata archaeon]
ASSYQLILAGKQAGDDESGLFGPALAELLDLPEASCAANLRFDAGAAKFTFERVVEGGVESGESPAPLVVSLQQAWNDPRTAKLPSILKSRKAPIDRVPWADVVTGLGATASARSRSVGFRLPAPRTGAKMVEFKTPQEAAQKLVKILREEAKVFP